MGIFKTVREKQDEAWREFDSKPRPSLYEGISSRIESLSPSSRKVAVGVLCAVLAAFCAFSIMLGAKSCSASLESDEWVSESSGVRSAQDGGSVRASAVSALFSGIENWTFLSTDEARDRAEQQIYAALTTDLSLDPANLTIYCLEGFSETRAKVDGADVSAYQASMLCTPSGKTYTAVIAPTGDLASIVLASQTASAASPSAVGPSASPAGDAAISTAETIEARAAAVAASVDTRNLDNAAAVTSAAELAGHIGQAAADALPDAVAAFAAEQLGMEASGALSKVALGSINKLGSSTGFLVVVRDRSLNEAHVYMEWDGSGYEAVVAGN